MYREFKVSVKCSLWGRPGASWSYGSWIYNYQCIRWLPPLML